MARVLTLTADLMFGSRVQAMLSADGHDVVLIGDGARVREELAQRGGTDRPVLVVDLTDPALDGIGLVQTLRGEDKLAGSRTLGFFSHVDTDTRARAQGAGFDLVVPRSRMAREGAALVRRLADGA
jgi:DNA-binding response OmpR family regulator